MGLLALLMIFLAPIAQITWSNRRLKNKTHAPIVGIMILMMVLGVGLSVAAFYLLCSQIPATNHGVCITGEVAFMIMGGFTAMVIVPIIGIVYGLIYHFKHQDSVGDEEVIMKINEVLKKHYK